MIYDNLLGKKMGKSLFKSYEPKFNDSVMYPFNTFSSLGYNVLAYYLIDTYNLLLLEGSFLFFFLGLASFFWWSSQRSFIQKIDNILCTLAFVWTSIFINNTIYSYTYLVNVFNLFVILVSYNNSETFLKLLNIGSVIYINYSFINDIIFNEKYCLVKPYVYLSLGIINKLNDSYLKFPYGTAFFHLFTSIGIYFLCKNNIVYY